MNSGVIAALTWLAVAALLSFLGLAALRFFTLRSRGTSVLLRALPAKNSHSWRHGIMCYDGEHVEYFKLRSVWPTCDLRLNRLDIELVDTRKLDDEEASFMSAATDVIHIRCCGVDYEIAADQQAMMAFGAWVEAAPSKRQERADYKRLRQRLTRHPKH